VPFYIELQGWIIQEKNILVRPNDSNIGRKT
jgi:hypothetical protein